MTDIELIEDLHAALCEALEALARGDTGTLATILKGARDQAAERIADGEEEGEA
jgi:hypothetical protein